MLRLTVGAARLSFQIYMPNPVLILGAGLAGLAAALELRQAGYRVEVLEYTDRAGGRCWS